MSPSSTQNHVTHVRHGALLARKPVVLLYYPDFGAMGGIEKFIEQTVQAFRARKSFEPVVVCTAGSPLFCRLLGLGVRTFGIKTLPVYKKPALRLLDIPSFIQITQILKQVNPELVHIHIGQVENLLFKVLGYPLVYSFHGYGSLYNLKATKNPLKRFFKRLSRPLFTLMTQYLDALLFVSQAEQERMIQEGYLSTHYPGEVLYNGIPVGNIQNRIQQMDILRFRKLNRIPQQARCVAFINRLDGNKNPLLFVEFAERLLNQEQFTDLHFVIAGSGPLEEALKARIRVSPYRGAIQYIGYREDIPELIGACDLIIHIPNEEGFGLGVLEAMAVGTPCLAYATGGIPEIMQFPFSHQLLVPVGDFESLITRADALLRLSDEEREILSRSLKERAAQFDQRIFIDRLEATYVGILENRRN